MGGGSIVPPLSLATNASYIPERYDVTIADENVKQAIHSNADLAAVIKLWTFININLWKIAAHSTLRPRSAQALFSTSSGPR